MTDKTQEELDKILDKIFSDFYSYNTNKEHISMPVGRAQKAIQALLNKQLVEELENLRREVVPTVDYAYFTLMKRVQEYLIARINQLKDIKGSMK